MGRRLTRRPICLLFLSSPALLRVSFMQDCSIGAIGRFVGILIIGSQHGQ